MPKFSFPCGRATERRPCASDLERGLQYRIDGIGVAFAGNGVQQTGVAIMIGNAKTGNAVTTYEVTVPVVILPDSGAVWDE